MHGNSAGEWCDPGPLILIAMEIVIVIGYMAARSGCFASGLSGELHEQAGNARRGRAPDPRDYGAQGAGSEAGRHTDYDDLRQVRRGEQSPGAKGRRAGVFHRGKECGQSRSRSDPMLRPEIGLKIALCFAVVRGNNCGNGSGQS